MQLLLEKRALVRFKKKKKVVSFGKMNVKFPFMMYINESYKILLFGDN